MVDFSKKDFADLSKYLKNALEHLFDYDLSIGSPLYSIYCLLKVCEEIADFNSL